MIQKKDLTAYIAGATGLTGGLLLKLLLDNPAFSSVVALLRTPLLFSHPKLVQQIIDFDQPQSADFEGGDYFFCCLGTTIKKAGSQEKFQQVDLHYVDMLAKFSADAGFSSFAVISSVGANKNSGNFYQRTKGLMEEAVSQYSFDKVLIFRPSLILGPRKEFRFGEAFAASIMKVFSPLMVGSLKQYKAIQASVIARNMLEESLAKKSGTYIITNRDMHQKRTNHEE
ncbi:MAG: oxidoreductase [Bacteroidales bacterium]|nr:oxidoreductase [Bacteroidales bacterium]